MGTIAGYDGGYWITPMSGRKTFPPNLLFALGERDDTDRVNDITRQVVDAAGDPDQLYQLLISEQIRYIYLGRRSGILSAQKMLVNPKYQLLYNYEGTWLFKVY